MSDLGETFKAWREEKRRKKKSNAKSSKAALTNAGFKFTEFSTHHLRVKNFDFWPSTGKWISVDKKKEGRGVFQLIALLKNPNAKE